MAMINVSAARRLNDPSSITYEDRERQLAEAEKEKEEAKRRERQSPFSRWTQFNNEHTKELMWLAMKHPKAHSILYFLVDQMDEYNAVMCSYKVLEEVLETSKATIQRNLQVLKNSGFIAVLKSGTSNVYAINDKVYWKSWGNNRKYSKFPANVVLALSEQDEGYQLSFSDIGATKQKEVFLKD